MKDSAKHDKQNFRHESLQDTESIQVLLKALTRGIGKGRLTFSDEDAARPYRFRISVVPSTVPPA